MGPIGSAVLTFIGYKQTNKQTPKQTDKPNLYIDERFVQTNFITIIVFITERTVLLNKRFYYTNDFTERTILLNDGSVSKRTK